MNGLLCNWLKRSEGIDLEDALMGAMGSQHRGKSDLFVILTTSSQSPASTGVL